MSKLEIREQIERELLMYDIASYKLKYVEGMWFYKTLSATQCYKDIPKSFDEEQFYPTRVTTGVLQILLLDEDFMNEFLDIYNRFRNKDWGDYSEQEKKDISKDPEYAKGIYKTSWGDIEIARMKTFTMALLPIED